MLVAVTYENEEVYQHFGHSKSFAVYEVDNGKVVSKRIFDSAGAGHGALAGFLNDNGVAALICGGIGGGAISALEGIGIKVYSGVSGNVNDAIAAFANGTLKAGSGSNCNQHDHDHHHQSGSSCKCSGHH